MLFFIQVLYPIFQSVACFRCRQRPLYRREREKVFGLNTLRRRKILSETVQPPDLFAFKEVCTNLMDGQGNMRLMECYMSDQDILLIALFPLSVVYFFYIFASFVPFRNLIFGLDFHADSLDILIDFLMCKFRI